MNWPNLALHRMPQRAPVSLGVVRSPLRADTDTMTQLGDSHIKCLCIALLIAMTASCASLQRIPESWELPESVQGKGCPDISGRYMHLGEAINGRAHIFLQNQWFFGDYKKKYSVPPGKWMEIRQILIRQDQTNQIEIVAMSDSGEIMGKRILKKENGDFSCQDGWIRVNGSTGFATSGGGEHTNHVLSFTKTHGYLIEKDEYNSFGMILVIPFVKSGTRWYRFSQIKSQPVSLGQ